MEDRLNSQVRGDCMDKTTKLLDLTYLNEMEKKICEQFKVFKDNLKRLEVLETAFLNGCNEPKIETAYYKQKNLVKENAEYILQLYKDINLLRSHYAD